MSYLLRSENERGRSLDFYDVNCGPRFENLFGVKCPSCPDLSTDLYTSPVLVNPFDDQSTLTYEGSHT